MSTSTVESLEVLYMPENMRLDLCQDLLDGAGARNIRVNEDRGEIVHNCVMPWHNESRPSASLNFRKMVYKCLGCGAQGGILWFVATINGLDGDKAREWLAGQTGFGGKEFELGPLLQYLDALDEAVAEKKVRPVTPVYSDKVLAPWDQIYPGLTTGVPDLNIKGRGIPEQNLIDARVGWDMNAMRVIIPHWWKDRLVGWQSRRIVSDGTPKYVSTPDFPRDSTLYRPPSGKRVVVVESPMSQLRHAHHLPVAGTFGFVLTEQQIALLKDYPEIIFFPDNDKAGWKTVEGWIDDQGTYRPGAAQTLAAYSNVRVVQHDWAGDPGDYDEDYASDQVDAAVPLWIWEKPSRLMCLDCKQYHGGECA